MEIGGKALEKQFEIMGEQQEKASEFIDKKVKTSYFLTDKTTTTTTTTSSTTANKQKVKN